MVRRAYFADMIEVRRSDSPTLAIVGVLAVCIGCLFIELWSIDIAQAAGAIGVGIQATPVTLTTTAQAGKIYHFSPVFIINNGKQPIRAHFRVEALNKGAQHVVPATWISFPSNSVALLPGASAHVPVALHVPVGAALGSYLSDIVVFATSAGPLSGTGAEVSAGAATKIEFIVATTAPPASQGIPKWVLPAGITIAVLLVLFLLWRSGIRIVIKKPS